VSAGSEHPPYKGTGTLLKGKASGHWIETWADGGRYEGEYRDGEKHGRGTFIWANGNRYEGEFRDDKFHGHGTSIWADGDRYEGDHLGQRQPLRGRVSRRQEARSRD
jgi:hypothetical protein